MEVCTFEQGRGIIIRHNEAGNMISWSCRPVGRRLAAAAAEKGAGLATGLRTMSREIYISEDIRPFIKQEEMRKESGFACKRKRMRGTGFEPANSCETGS